MNQKIWRWLSNKSAGFHFIVILVVTSLVAKSHASVNYKMLGDVNLGGLFALNTYDETTGTCGALRDIGYLKRLEAMVYAIDRVNNNTALLPNITLGFQIYGTCREYTSTLRECLNFIPSVRESGKCSASESDEILPIVGVLGSKTSSSSIHAALILGLYHIPQISYLSTSDDLSNKNKYPYFLRTIGPDRYQVSAMVDILLYFNWNYVSFIYVDDSYGRNAYQLFELKAADNDICVGIHRKIALSDTDDIHYDRVISDLLEIQRGSHATVVIMFLHEEMVKNVLIAQTRLKAQRRFIWIGSDAWGTFADEMALGNEGSAVGSFVMVPASETLPEFNEYFGSLTPETSTNPWLTEYLKQRTNCTDNEETSSVLPNCNEPGLLGTLNTQFTTQEMLVMDAVFAFAYALDNLYRNTCPNTTSDKCQEFLNIKGEDLLEELLSTRFISLANRYVNFTSTGDVPGRYIIQQLQQVSTGDFKYVDVGKWNKSTTSDNVIQKEVPWYLREGTSHNIHTGIPRSVCSDPCRHGERVIVSQDNLCCWTCSPCYSHEIVVDNKCRSCIDSRNQVFAWPDKNITKCIPIEASKKAWATAIIVASSLGMVVTSVTVGLYTYNRQNSLIKASSRELSYIMFVGILLAYFTAIIWAVPPTNTVCVLLSVCPTLSTSLIYVSLAMKTIRIYRIFRAGEKSAKSPKFISSKSQIFFTLAITTIPVLWAVIWIFVNVPGVAAEMPYHDRRHLQKTCSRTSNGVDVIGAITWSIGNLLVCSILALVTRKLPENYNESRYITFCSFCSLVVFMAFSSTAYTTVDAYFRAGYACLGLIVNATITLICLFAVKIYAIYFVKLERWNVRKPLGVTHSPEQTGSESAGLSSGSNRPDNIGGATTECRLSRRVSEAETHPTSKIRPISNVGVPAWSEGSHLSSGPSMEASQKDCK